MKHFDKVVREGKRPVHAKGDRVVVTEKLDGANASISVSLSSDNSAEVKIFSRRKELSLEDGLRGGYQYAIENVSDLLVEFLINNELYGTVILFGEWLVPHKVAYKEDKLNKFYHFAFYMADAETYSTFSWVKKFADHAGLECPEVFFEGEFNTLSDLTGFAGKSSMTVAENAGEGIVIFNESNADEGSRTKIVTEKFCEMQNVKTHKPKDFTESQLWAFGLCTEARIEKCIHKLIDEGALPEIKFENFPLIAKPVSELVFSDMLDEEGDTVPKLFDEKAARKASNKKVPNVIRKFIEGQI